MKNSLTAIVVIASILLPWAFVAVGYVLVAQCYLNAIASETFTGKAFWLSATKFVFVSPIYAFKIYQFCKTGTWGEEGSTFLAPLNVDILYWGGTYVFFAILAVLIL